ATVRNSGDQARETHATVTLDGHPGGSPQRVAISGAASTEVEFTGAAKIERASVAIEDRDGLQADNVRYVVHDNRSSVLLVTSTGDLNRDGFYVEKAISAADSGGLQVSATSAGSLSGRGAVEWSSNAAVVLLSTRGLERRGREALAAFVRNGGGLL